MFRVGHGYDSHCFEEGKPLKLGGVHIPFPQGMKAHSDGDVVLHAVCDAILGAAAMGDIGQHFPDSDDAYANEDSRFFVRTVKDKISEQHFRLNNLDVTILAQVPKLAPYIKEMRQNLATDLDLDLKMVNIKATTNEEMGFVGRCEGIACYAIVLLEDLSS
jgi:2-C-methyl-D-erythritol 2,4-cyclodiphosphate synthase